MMWSRPRSWSTCSVPASSSPWLYIQSEARQGVAAQLGPVESVHLKKIRGIQATLGHPRRNQPRWWPLASQTNKRQAAGAAGGWERLGRLRNQPRGNSGTMRNIQAVGRGDPASDSSSK
jgi:hypothetical protein